MQKPPPLPWERFYVASNPFTQWANETGNVYAADIEDLQSRLEEIWELSRQALAHLAIIR